MVKRVRLSGLPLYPFLPYQKKTIGVSLFTLFTVPFSPSLVYFNPNPFLPVPQSGTGKKGIPKTSSYLVEIW